MAKFQDMTVFVGNRTAKAVQLTFFPDDDEMEKEIWVPLSVLEDESDLDEVDEDGNATVSVAKWFMQKNDIDYSMEEEYEEDDTYSRFEDDDEIPF